MLSDPVGLPVLGIPLLLFFYEGDDPIFVSLKQCCAGHTLRLVRDAEWRRESRLETSDWELGRQEENNLLIWD